MDEPVKARRKKPSRLRKGTDANGAVPYVRYSAEVAQRICLRLAQGQVWHQFAGQEGIPGYETFYKWKRTKPEFAALVEAAREMGADFSADRALVVAEGAHATPNVNSARLLISHLQWRAAKANPKRYGSKPGEGPKAKTAEPVAFYFRQFERVVGEDGRTYVREILPEPPPKGRRGRKPKTGETGR